MDGLAAEAGGEALGLLHALLVQRRVGRLGGARHHVGRATVADEEHLALVRLGAAECGLGDGLGAVETGHAVTVARRRADVPRAAGPMWQAAAGEL